MKKLFLILAVLALLSGTGQASPLDDFAPGRWAVDLSWKPHVYMGANAFDFGVAAGLGNNWAVAYRQIGYDTAGESGDYRTTSRDLCLVRKLGDGLQLFVGGSRTTGRGQGSGDALAAKTVLQAGAIAIRKLSDRLTLYGILGGGSNVTNVEFGLYYRISPSLELTSTYRHLTVEKVGSARAKENFRGFGLGVTVKI
jgi:hypothetical protein